MKYNLFTLLFLAFIFIIHSCSDEAEEGSIVTEPNIKKDQFEDFYYEISEEEDLCNLIDIGVLTKYFPGAESYSTNGLGLSQFGNNNGGCALSWTPEEDIRQERGGKYFHISPKGTIEVKYNVNPDTSIIDGFAYRPLKTKMNPGYQKGPDSLGLDSKYYKVDNVGSFAIWNDGSSSLSFAMGEDVLFTIVVKYPLSSEERKNIAKDLGQALVRNLTTQKG